MISKTSSKSGAAGVYLHTFLRALSDGKGVFMAALFALLILIPGSTAGIPDNSIFNVDVTHNQMKYRFFLEDLTAVIGASAVIAGVAMGICLFRFMLSRSSSDFIFSLGVTRRKQLWLRVLAGSVYLAAAIFIPLLLSLACNLAAFGTMRYTDLMLAAVPYLFGMLFSLALVGFGASILVCCLVGTVLESVLYSVLVLFMPTALWYSARALAGNLLFGSAVYDSSETDGLLSVLSQAKWNPLTYFYAPCENYSAQYVRFDDYVLPERDWLLLVCWLAGTAVLFAAADFALHRRRAEIAENAGKSTLLNIAATFTLAFFGFATALDIGMETGTAFAMITASAVFFLLYFIFEKLQKRKIRADLYRLPIQAGAVALAVTILMTGGLGYSGRVPEAQKIVSVEMSYVGSPNYFGGTLSGMSYGNSYYLQSSYTFSEPADIDLALSLHEALIDAGKGRLELNETDFEQTTVAYDISVTYTLTNGRRMTRYYDRTTFAVLETLLNLDNTAAVKDAIQQTVTGGGSSTGAVAAFRSGQIYLASSWYDSPKQLVLTDVQRTELLQCIADDLAEQSVTDRYFSDAPPLGVMMFTQSGGEESLTFSYQLENALVYVTDAFTHTLNYLKTNGLYAAFAFSGEIEEISLQKYDPYVGINSSTEPQSPYFMAYASDSDNDYIQTKDFGTDIVIDDAVQLSELSALLRNDYFMSGGGYLACIKLKGSDRYIYKFLPAADVPDYVTGG